MVSALPWSWCLLFCRVEETATGIHENCFTSAKYCVASQTDLEGDTEALYHGLFQMQRWHRGPCKILASVCFINRKHQTIFLWGAAKTEHTGSYPCKKPENEPFSRNCAQKETPFSSLLPLSCTWPLLACPGNPCSCSQPHFPLLEPARKLPRSPSCCRRSGGSRRCAPSSPFRTLWLLPHWPKSPYNQPWSALKRTRRGGGTPSLRRGRRAIETDVLFISCIRDVTRAQEASGSTSARAHFVPIEEGIVKQSPQTAGLLHVHTCWLSLFWQRSNQNWAGNSASSEPWDKGMPKGGIPVIEYVSHINAMHKWCA